MIRRGISTFGRVGVAAIAALVLAVLLVPAVASAAEEGAITGKVTRAADGTAVAAANVCADEQEAPFEVECGPTAADGTYEISGLVPGEYFVTFEASASDPFLIHQLWDGVTDQNNADRLLVSAGATRTGIDATLPEGGAIAGRVTAIPGGGPVPGEVRVCTWREALGEEFDGCAEAAADGTYEIRGVHPGPHELQLSSSDFDYEAVILNSVAVTAGVRKSGVDAALPLLGRITGHVSVAATGQPLAEISVCGIWAETGELGGCTKTDSSGDYEFFPVVPGELKIVFSPEPDEVELQGEVEADGWPTQYWDSKPTLAQAEAISVTFGSVFTGIDGMLGPEPPLTPAPPSDPPDGNPRSDPPDANGPASSAPSAGDLTPTPVSKRANASPLPSPRCRKGFVKKREKGRTRCVRRPRRPHHRRHR